MERGFALLMNTYPTPTDELRRLINDIEGELARPEYQPNALRLVLLKDAHKVCGKASDSLDLIQRICEEMREVLDQMEIADD
jgi:hypothetical protein